MVIRLDPHLETALREKSRQLNTAPEEIVAQLVRLFVEGRLLLPDSEFAEGLTVAEYLALSDAEEAALWDAWEQQAHRKTHHIMRDAKPNAIPAR